MGSPFLDAHLEPELVRAARDGRPEAWETLVARFGPTVWSLCRRSTSEAEDAYQDVWERVHRSLPAWDPARGPLAGWIVTLTHRILVDRHRRATVRGEVVEPTDVADPVAPVDAALVDHDRRAALEIALTRLPEAHRRVVLLHHQHGVPLERIAIDEGVPLGTIKSRLHRARARLTILLGDDR